MNLNHTPSRWGCEENKYLLILLIMIILLGGVLRVYRLGLESIFLDEAYSIELAKQSLSANIKDLVNNNPPLFQVLLHYWIRLFGTSEIAVRSLSVIFGIISLWMLYNVGKLLFNKEVGLISAFLLAIYRFHIQISQETRGYSLLIMLTLCSFFSLIKWLKTDRLKFYIYYFVTTVLLVYTHFYGLFLLMAQNLYFIIYWDEHEKIRLRWFVTQGCILLAFLPWFLMYTEQIHHLASGGFWITKPLWKDLTGTIKVFCGFIKGWRNIYYGKTELLFLFLVFFLLGHFSTDLKGKWNWEKPLKSISELTWSASLKLSNKLILLLLWLLSPIIIPFVISQLFIPLYATKYTMGALPAFYLLIARGIYNLKVKVLITISIGLILLLSLGGIADHYLHPKRPFWRDAVRFVEDHSQKDDTILVISKGFSHKPFDYYYKGTQKRHIVSDSQELSEFLKHTIFKGKKRFWIILRYNFKQEVFLIEKLKNNFSIRKEKFKGIFVYSLDYKGP